MPRTILGLAKDIEDPGSGAVTRFHAVTAYMVMLRSESSSVTLASWVSQAAHDAGKNPLAHVSMQIKARPTGDSEQFPQWFYTQILAVEAAHHLSGADVVYSADPDATEVSV